LGTVLGARNNSSRLADNDTGAKGRGNCGIGLAIALTVFSEMDEVVCAEQLCREEEHQESSPHGVFEEWEMGFRNGSFSLENRFAQCRSM
jgi:hypothetical protein